MNKSRFLLTGVERFVFLNYIPSGQNSNCILLKHNKEKGKKN